MGVSNLAPSATAAAAPASTAPPLVVDLDGTLVRSDLLLESALLTLRRKPVALLHLPAVLLRGRAALKRELAETALPDVQTLPYRAELLDCLREQRSRGRRIILVTAADRRIAEAVAAHLGLFDMVLASDGIHNLGGEAKRRRLVELFGEHGYVYVADSRQDLPVWASAHSAWVVGAPPRFCRAVSRITRVECVFPGRPSPTDLLRALRPHQWLKNLLVLLPLLAAHRLFEPLPLLRACLALVAFCACASGVYLLNDLLDLPKDRRHPSKRRRPLAAGLMSIPQAIALLAVLEAAALFLALVLSPWVAVVLCLYFKVNAAYSLGLKDHAVLDVLLLAGGYAARIAAGAAAVGIALSPWLLAFCMFLFFSLALLKRFAELVAARVAQGAHAHARGYLLDDAGVMVAQGIASGYIGVLVLALYTNSSLVQNLQGRYWLFWFNCLLLLYWVSYLWLMADRGKVVDDPVTFALQDRVSRLLLAGMAAAALAAA